MSLKEQREADQKMIQLQQGMVQHLRSLSKRELIRTIMGQVDLILELRNENNQLKSGTSQIKEIE